MNIGNNALAVPKPSFVMWLITLKVLIVNLRTKTSSQKISANTFAQMTTMEFKTGKADDQIFSGKEKMLEHIN